MITASTILRLHELSINKYGGSPGIKDESLLDIAVAKPYQTFEGEAVYPFCFEKAAAVGESLIVNRPFVDGNKRTGFLAMLAFLKEEKLEITVSSKEVINFITKIAAGKITFEETVEWLRINTTQ